VKFNPLLEQTSHTALSTNTILLPTPFTKRTISVIDANNSDLYFMKSTIAANYFLELLSIILSTG